MSELQLPERVGEKEVNIEVKRQYLSLDSLTPNSNLNKETMTFSLFLGAGLE